jgi:hypothetical protein
MSVRVGILPAARIYRDSYKYPYFSQSLYSDKQMTPWRLECLLVVCVVGRGIRFIAKDGDSTQRFWILRTIPFALRSQDMIYNEANWANPFGGRCL